jgi:hypothetical protein
VKSRVATGYVSGLVLLALACDASALTSSGSMSVGIVITIKGGNSTVTPKIVSEARLWVVEGESWDYEVEIDPRKLRQAATHSLNNPFNMIFELAAGPADMEIFKISPTKAKVQWQNPVKPSPTDNHVRVRVLATDTISGSADSQDLLLYVTDLPTGGG